jgi:hypothetical protein
MKKWYPHKLYLRELKVYYKDYPEEIRFQELVLKLDIEKRCRQELKRRVNHEIRIENQHKIMREIQNQKIIFKINQRVRLPKLKVSDAYE